MKVSYISSLIFCIFFIPSTVFAESNGNQDWTQYRFNSDNNPVLNIDSLNPNEQTMPTDNQIRSTPVVADNKVFVGNHNSGKLYAYNLINGELLWQNEAPNWVHSEMIYAGGQLFVGYGNRFFQDNGIRGTNQSGLLSLDPKTGEIIWNYQTDGEVMPTPAYYDDTVYITTGDKQLYGIDPKTGKEQWTLRLGSVVSMSSPNIKDGILYVGGSSPYKFFAVDLDERAIKWEHSFKKVTSELDDVPPVVSDQGMVYTTAVQDTNKSFVFKRSV